MAAHVLTATKQVFEDIQAGRLQWSHLEAALNISCWTEQLDLDEYRALADIVKAQDTIKLAFWLGAIATKYKPVWDRLGQPRTMEDWVHLRYQEITGQKELAA